MSEFNLPLKENSSLSSYDLKGQKVRSDDGTNVTNYLIDHRLPYGQVVAEYQDGLTSDAVHTYGLERISQNRGGSVNFYFSDGQQSIRNLTDASGNITDSYSYYGFGDALSSSGTTENSFRYVGEELNGFTNLYNLRSRWYNQGNGRFVSVDPFDGYEGSPMTLHRYGYVSQSPISFNDPTGEFIQAMYAAGISGILAAVAMPIWGATNSSGSALSREGFDKLWNAYPKAPLSSSGVYTLIGGKVLWNYLKDPVGFENSCALRMSRAMNYGGHTISYSKRKTGSGDDDKWYYYKVKDLLPVIKSTFGSPDETNVKRSDVQMKRGIILFEQCGNTQPDGTFRAWTNATGHIDLWNKMMCGSNCYWNKCSKVSFWRFK